MPEHVKKIGAGIIISFTLSIWILTAWIPRVAVASEPDDIIGQWLTADGDAIIELYRCGSEYCGRIVWSKDPCYHSDDEMGMGGQPRVDRLNPDPKLRSRPLVGLTILKGFVFSGDRLWKDGTVYNPDNGKTYKCILRLMSGNRLGVKGYIAIPLFGKTTVWTRSQIDPRTFGRIKQDHGNVVHD